MRLLARVVLIGWMVVLAACVAGDGDAVNGARHELGGWLPLPITPVELPPFAAVPEETLVATQPFGRLDGVHSVDQGQFGYSLPVRLPAGTGGWTPSVSLAYGSGHGASVAGVGWALRAGSVIHRCQPMGSQVRVAMRHTDNLCLDGKPLVEVAPGQFRTRPDENLKISSGSSFSYQFTRVFTVVAPETGIVSTYERIAGDEVDGDARGYYLTREQDPHGNYVTYAYRTYALSLDGTTPTLPTVTLTRIAYTGNESLARSPRRWVDFIYENNPERSTKYVGGVAVSDQKRVREIRVNAPNTSTTTLVYSYHLGYRPGTNLLTSVTFKDAKGGSLPPTVFEYSDEHTDGWPSMTLVDAASFVAPQGEVPDRAYRANDYSLGVREGRTVAIPHLTPRWEPGTHDFEGLMSCAPLAGHEPLCLYRSRACDNAGRFPRLSYNLECELQSQEVWVYAASSSGGGPLVYVGEKPANLITGDFDGDGAVDVLSIPVGEGYLDRRPEVFFTPSGAEHPSDAVGLEGDLDISRLVLQDINGDGSHELIVPEVGGQQYRVYTMRWVPPGPRYWGYYSFVRLLEYEDDTVRIARGLFADVNGDSLADFIDVPAQTVRLNTGKGWAFPKAFFDHTGNTIPPKDFRRDRVVVTDLNQDGRADLGFLSGCEYAHPHLQLYATEGNAMRFKERVSLGAVSCDDIELSHTPPLKDSSSELDGISIARWDGPAAVVQRIVPSRVGGRKMLRVRSGMGERVSVEYGAAAGGVYQSTSSHKRAGTVVTRVTQGPTVTDYYYGPVARSEKHGPLGFVSETAVTKSGLTFVASETVRGYYEWSDDTEAAVVPYVSARHEYTGSLRSALWRTQGRTERFRYEFPDSVSERTFYTRLLTRDVEWREGPPGQSYVPSDWADTRPLQSFTRTELREYDDFGYPGVVEQSDGVNADGLVPRSLATVAYEHDRTYWRLGRPQSIRVEKFDGNGRKTELLREYLRYSAAGQPEVIRTSGTELEPLTTTLTYQGDGNVERQTHQGRTLELSGAMTLQTRETSFGYDREGVFPRWVERGDENKQWLGVHPVTGVLAVTVDQYGTWHRTTHDFAGRTRETSSDADEETTRVDYERGLNSRGMTVRSTSASGAQIATHLDEFGRPARVVENLGPIVREFARSWNELGQLVQESSPHRVSYNGSDIPESDAQWTSYHYDGLARLERIEGPQGETRRFAYEPQVRHEWDADGRYSREVFDHRGRLMERWVTPKYLGDTATGASRNHFEVTAYEYNPLGQQSAIVDAAGHRTSLVHDARGALLRVDEPNRGWIEHEYNAFAEPIRTRNALYQKSTVRDELGRPVHEVGADYAKQWKWSENGELFSIRSSSGHVRSFDHDAYGRVTGVHEAYQRERYAVFYDFDRWGRNERQRIQLPDDGGMLSIRTKYSGAVPVRKFVEPGSKWSGTDLWRATDHDYYGTSAARLAGDVQYSTERDLATGRLVRQTALEDAGSRNFVDVNYEYYDSGLLERRVDAGFGTQDSFEYDGLGRLARWHNWAFWFGGTSTDFAYDKLGNLTSKSGNEPATLIPGKMVGGSYRPALLARKVVDGRSESFEHDVLGRVTKSATVDRIEYTSFDLPTRIEGGGQFAEYTYGVDQRRVAKRIADGEVIYFHDGSHRIERERGREVHRYQVPLDEYVSAEFLFGAEDDVRYNFLDRQGTPVAVRSVRGGTVERPVFDPFGQPMRYAEGGIFSAAPTQSMTSVGYTGHERDLEFGLTNMRGRMYDPETKRFLTADPYMDVRDSQGMNPFAYVRNSPTRYTDPTGFCTEEERSTGRCPEDGTAGTTYCGGADCMELLRRIGKGFEDAGNAIADTATDFGNWVGGLFDGGGSGGSDESPVHRGAAASTPVSSPGATTPTVAPDRPSSFTVGSLGNADYYTLREADFRRRNPGMEPPDYYLGYGDKYLRRFSELAPDLSEAGQRWLWATRRNLQLAMEEYIQDDPEGFAELERNAGQFRLWAFRSHPDAYLNAGLTHVPYADRLRIMFVPDLSDVVFSEAGRDQVWQVGAEVVEQDVTNFILREMFPYIH